MPVLGCIQNRHGQISPEAEKNAAEYLDVPLARVHEVVSFYHLFYTNKIGKYHFSVCQTTSCALRGAEDIIAHIQERLNIKPGEMTPDGKFSLSVVECLGACEMAPVMQGNQEHVGCLNKKKIDEIIEKYG